VSQEIHVPLFRNIATQQKNYLTSCKVSLLFVRLLVRIRKLALAKPFNLCIFSLASKLFSYAIRYSCLRCIAYILYSLEKQNKYS
jgi:hypothetical protein